MENLRSNELSRRVAGNLLRIRTKKGQRMRREDLADLLAAAGFPELTASAITNIETGRTDQDGRWRRAITIDELSAFAEVFRVPLTDLLEPSCATCYGHPATGFTCNACGKVA